MEKLFTFLFAIGLMIGLWVGISALLAMVASWLWNFIALETHHPDGQISFWVAWAGMILLSLIAQPFRVTVKSKSE